MASPDWMDDLMFDFLLSEEQGLVAEVAKRANFTPFLVNISKYPNSWGEGEETYDMVAADLTVTEVRERTMDFSIPFMKLGLTGLMQKVPSQPIDLLAIFKPFSFGTWMLLLSSYLLTSLLFLVTSRLDQPPPSPLACFWLPLASLLGQSTDWLPSSAPPRLLITAWWLTALLATAAYTANLAAFLTVSRWGVYLLRKTMLSFCFQKAGTADRLCEGIGRKRAGNPIWLDQQFFNISLFPDK